MGQALYRKYRSKRLEDVVGQDHITKTLQNALKNDTVSHAYLFTGPKGVGKTSVARILAHELLGVEYNGQNYLDIIEIDAASNRKIDEIRNLREQVNVAPSHGKYKVYIIDEVHMLTKEAFNALLKTLEEPPAHVVFILATTELHKVPDTIISRTQRFTFKPIEPGAGKKHLKHIAKEENITVDDKALGVIIEHADGSFRDAISLLEQASHHTDHVTETAVMELLGVPPADLLDELFNATNQHAYGMIVQLLAQSNAQGYSPSHIARELLQLFQKRFITQPDRYQTDLQTMKELLAVQAAPKPATALELCLLGYNVSIVPLQPTQPKPTEVSTGSNNHTDLKPSPAKHTERVEVEVAKAKPGQTPTRVAQPASGDLWQDVVQDVKSRHNTLYAVVRMADPIITDDSIELRFAFPFHYKRIADPQNLQIVSETVHKISGKAYTVSAILVNDQESVPVSNEISSVTEGPKTGNLETITNIFGAAEVLES